MATLALGVIGGAAGLGPAGAAATAILGAQVDNRYLFPLIFPAEEVAAPEFGDITTQSGDAGKPVRIMTGPENRVDGDILWQGEINPANVQPGGGKGSTASVTSAVDYRVSLAILWGAGPMNKVVEIWADGTPIYKDQSAVDIDTALLTVTKYTTNRWNNTSDASEVDTVYMDLESPSGGPDLSDLRSGLDATLAGFTDAGNNGTFRVVSSEINTSTGVSNARLRNSGAVTAAANSGQQIDQTLPTFPNDAADSFTNYLGTDTQNADPIIEAVKGAGNVPGFRGMCYTVMENFKLNEFGNRIPQFVALIEEASTKSLSVSFSDCLDRQGYASTEYDVSGITGNMRGYAVSTPISGFQYLTPLMSAYNVTCRESQGKLVFTMRGSLTEVAVSTDKLGAHIEGDETPPKLLTRQADKNTLPSDVVVGYRDPIKDYQKEVQPARNSFATDINQRNPTYPLVMNAADATALAYRLLWTAIANSDENIMSLPPSQLHIEETDVITFTLDGQDRRVLALRMDKSPVGVMNVEGVAEVASTLDFSGIASQGPEDQERSTYIPPESRLDVLDIAPLRDTEYQTTGFYWSTAAYDSSAQFVRTHLYRANDPNYSSYTSVQTLRQESATGDVVGTIPDEPHEWWDKETSIVVKLDHGTLSSSTEAEVLNGDANWGIFGHEIIGFVTASLTGTREYTLSNLLRGRRGTEYWTGRHAANERFVLLDESTVHWKNKNRGHIGRSFRWKGVPHQGAQTDFQYQQLEFEGNTLRPFGPWITKVIHNSNLEYNLYWAPRSRRPGNILPGPVRDSEGRFDVFFYNDSSGSQGSLISYVAMAGTPMSDEYTLFVGSSTHTSMGLTLGQAHWVEVVEVSTTYGRGLPSAAKRIDL